MNVLAHRYRTPFALILAVGFFSTTGVAAEEERDARSFPPVISVSGSGEVRVPPDEATVSLGVTAEAEDAGRAQEKANEIANRVLESVTKAGIEKSAVQTSRLMLDPVYSQPGPAERRGEQPFERKIVGYRASNVVSVTATDLARIGPVIDASVAAGANEVQGVHFRLRDDTAARERAVTRAVADARSTASAMAKALGVTLGPVLEAREGGAQTTLPQMNVRALHAESMAASQTPVSPGEVEIHVRIDVTYRIAEP